MKLLIALTGCCLALALAACGSAGSGETTAAEVVTRKPLPPRAPAVKMTKAEISHAPPLTLPRPSGPTPHHMVAINLRNGRGPGVPQNDWVTNREEVFIRFLEASYPGAREGHEFGQIAPHWTLLEGMSKGLAHGLVGMKVGGRRELIVPPRLAYPRWKSSWGYAPYVSIYVVDLLGMRPPADRRVEYRNRPFGRQGQS